MYFNGQPRRNGNTAALLEPFIEALSAVDRKYETIWLSEKDLRPCTACRNCQKDWIGFHCPQPDDMQDVFDAVRACDLLVLATPIYSWYCTPPMKAVLDRLVYGMNKYYGETMGPSLWEGKPAALITTCGYRPERGADLWEEGFKRYCKHSRLRYLGMLAEWHLGYDTVFMDDAKKQHAIQFAEQLIALLHW